MKPRRLSLVLIVLATLVVIAAFWAGMRWGPLFAQYLATAGKMLLWVLPIPAWIYFIQPFLRGFNLEKKLGATLERFAKTRPSEGPKELPQLVGKWRKVSENMAGKQLLLVKDPWYLWLGPSSSGKTQGIRNGGFKLRISRDETVGPTDYVDLWPITGAMFVDSAGMLTDQEPGHRELLHEILNLLKEVRHSDPINGLILVIPATSLIPPRPGQHQEREAARAKEADSLRISVRDVRDVIKKRFPVYVVVTKSDLMDGFPEFFSTLDNSELRYQIFGWSNQEDLDTAFEPGSVRAQLGLMARRLNEVRLRLLRETALRAENNQNAKVDQLFALSRSFERVIEPLENYLKVIFGPEGSPDLFVRGVYFTSSMQASADRDRQLFERLGIPCPVETKLEDRPYFWRDLIEEKALKESGLVTSRTKVVQWIQHHYAKLYVGLAIGALTWLAFAALMASSLTTEVTAESKFWEAAAASENWTTYPVPWEKNGPLWQPVVDITSLEFLGHVSIGRDGTLGSRLSFHSNLAYIVRQPVTKLTTYAVTRRLDRLVGERPELQRFLFEASVVDPIVWATRARLLRSEGITASDEPRLINAITNLLAIEAAASGPLGETTDTVATRTLSLSDYLWREDQPLEAIGLTNLIFCVGASKQPTTPRWPSARLSDGSNLLQNRPIREGLNTLKQSVKQDLDCDNKQELFRNLHDQMDKLKNAEEALTTNTLGSGDFISSNNYFAFEKEATTLRNLLKNKGTTLLATNINTLTQALEKYQTDCSNSCQTAFGPIEQFLRAHTSEDLPLFDDIQKDLQSFKGSLTLKVATGEESRRPFFDQVFLRKDANQRYLFDVRLETYLALIQPVAFPLVSSKGSTQPALSGEQLVRFHKALANYQNAEADTAFRDHVQLLKKVLGNRFAQLKITEALVDTSNEVRTCQIFLSPHPKSRHWAFMNTDAQLNISTALTTDQSLGSFPVDKPINIWLTNKRERNPEMCKFPQLGTPWAAISVLNQAKNAGGRTNWLVTLEAEVPNHPSEYFGFRFVFPSEIPQQLTDSAPTTR